MHKFKAKSIIKITAVIIALSLLCPEKVYGSNLDNKKDYIKELEEEGDKLQESIKDLKGDISIVSEKLKSTENDLRKAEEKREECEKNIAITEKNIIKKRELMKERIKFTYENPSVNSIFMLVTTSKSWTDFLNIKEYVKRVALYDEKVLSEYDFEVRHLEEEKEVLIKIEEEIKVSQENLEKEKNALLSVLSKEQESLSKNEEEIAALTKIIKDMEEYEKRLVATIRPPESAKVEKEISIEAQKENTSGRPVTPQIGEEELLAAIIYCEAGNEPYEGMLAVGSVVLNRVNSSRFPNTITEVVYAPGQFSPVASGRLAMSIEQGLVNAQSKQAAKDVLSGNITGNWLFFRRDDGTREGQVISRQVFY